MTGDLAARIVLEGGRRGGGRALALAAAASRSPLEIHPPAAAGATDSEAPVLVEPKPVPEPVFYDGQILPDPDGGPGYVLSNVTKYSATMRLALPKIRGKATRKALKRERQRAAGLRR